MLSNLLLASTKVHFGKNKNPMDLEKYNQQVVNVFNIVAVKQRVLTSDEIKEQIS